jgi:NhaA family Na+:H+ antiporter
MASAQASGVLITPTFFIDGRRYDGPWDETSFADAMLGRLGHRVQAAALDFAAWAPSAGALLLIATVLSMVLMNSTLGSRFAALWEQPFGFMLGGSRFRMSLLDWINEGLLTMSFNHKLRLPRIRFWAAHTGLAHISSTHETVPFPRRSGLPAVPEKTPRNS